MRLYHNLASLNLYRNNVRNLEDQSKALGRISTGSKINSAKDNPNKIGESEFMRIQIRGLQAAQKNLQDGASMLQTADGALSSVSDALIRMKELVVASGNGAYSEDERNAISKEIESLKEHINSVANNTEFNGVKLLNTDGVTDNNSPKAFSLSSGANVGDVISIPLYNITTDVLKDEKGNSLSNIDLSDPSKIDENMSVVDAAIKEINSIRSKYGALQQRLESTADNSIATSNIIERAESRVRDADIAEEMMEFSKAGLLSEAGNAMMAQTNRFPQEVLRILERMK